MSEDTDTRGPLFLRRVLGAAAARLDVRLLEESTTGPRGDTIGSRVLRNGTLHWLRVAPFRADRMDKEWWTGNLDANVLTGIRRPRVVDRAEWTHAGVEVGADVMEYAASPTLAPERLLQEPFDAPDSWWTDLRVSLDHLAEQPSSRDLTPMCRGYQQGVVDAFGDRVAPEVPAWSTQLGDLHWGQLTAPELWILDWELWGRAIHGLGPASLYCMALGVPEIAQRVYDTFAHVLDTPAGRYALLAVITDLTAYDDPSPPTGWDRLVRSHAAKILDQL